MVVVVVVVAVVHGAQCVQLGVWCLVGGVRLGAISEVSRIKKMVMEGNYRNPDFDRESLSLRKFAETEADVASFFELG